MKSLLALILFCSSPSAWGYITLDNSASTWTTASNLTNSLTLTVGTGSNRALFVFVTGYPNPPDSIATIVDNGTLSLTKILRENDGSHNVATEVWYAVNPPSGSNSIVVTWAAYGNSEDWAIGAVSLAGVAQTGTIDTYAGSVFGLGTTAQSDSVTAGAKDWILDSEAGTITGSEVATPNGGQTAVLNLLTGSGYGTQTDLGISYIANVSPGSTTMGWTMPSSDYAVAHVVVAIKAAYGYAPPTSGMILE
jgi:hypothetical protein